MIGDRNINFTQRKSVVLELKLRYTLEANLVNVNYIDDYTDLILDEEKDKQGREEDKEKSTEKVI